MKRNMKYERISLVNQVFVNQTAPVIHFLKLQDNQFLLELDTLQSKLYQREATWRVPPLQRLSNSHLFIYN